MTTVWSQAEKSAGANGRTLSREQMLCLSSCKGPGRSLNPGVLSPSSTSESQDVGKSQCPGCTPDDYWSGAWALVFFKAVCRQA